MPRLPQPGGDIGNWGEILNDYLSQTHKPDGTLKDNIITSANLTQDVQDKLDTVTYQQGVTGYTLNTQSGAAYTAQLSDSGKMIITTSGSAVTITIPLNASAAFAVGTRIMVFQQGSGQVTFAGAGGVTLQADPGLKIATQYGGAELIKLATNTWAVVGRLAA